MVERNLRTPYGEIDLIAQDGSVLVFIEIKTRTTNAYGPPEASITQQKREHIKSASQAFLQTLFTPTTNWRIEVIVIR